MNDAGIVGEFLWSFRSMTARQKGGACDEHAAHLSDWNRDHRGILEVADANAHIESFLYEMNHPIQKEQVNPDL